MAVSDLAAALRHAVGLHQRGQLESARTAYAAILVEAPEQPDALHLLGVIERQQGRPLRALELIGRAIGLQPHQATMHCNLGVALQDLGRTEQSLASYDAALALDGRYAMAWCNRGNALRKLGHLDAALASYAEALAIRPSYPEAHCNRAIALHDAGRDEEAVAAAAQALALRAHYADALCARGNALHALGRHAEAVADFASALVLDPDRAPAHCWHGIALHKLGHAEAAIASYRRTIALREESPDAWHFLGNALRSLGRDAEALAAYRRALALGAPAATVEFAIAALTEGEAPAGAPQSYVKALFDGYAAHFDAHLVGELAYRTPALIDAALQRHLPGTVAATLDLGCGTGLCAPLLRPRSRRLLGVDLSERMLDRARAGGLYDALECAEIGVWLDASIECFDLLVAADVLVYFGALAPLFARIERALRAGGHVAFSVERLEEGNFKLQPSGRHAHALSYIQECGAGLVLAEATPAVLRHDRGAPVEGYIVVMRKPGQAPARSSA